jgi:hypothetical protein
MAIWVNVNRVAFFPEVIKVYGRAGRGQGSTQSAGATTPAHAPKGFLQTVKRAMSEGVIALPAWIRPSPLGGPSDWQNAQIDITAIPGVPVLRKVNGKRRIF